MIAGVSLLCLGSGRSVARTPEVAGPLLEEPGAGISVPESGGVRSGQPAAKMAKAESLPLGKARESVKTATTGSAEPSKGVFDPGTMTTFGSLALVILVIAGIAAVTRRAALKSGGLWAALGPGGRAPSGVLEVLGRYPVGRGCTLVLLKLDRRILLVSQSSGGKLSGVTMTTLTEVTDVEDVASILLKTRDAETDESAKRFERMLTDADRAFHRVRTGEVPMDLDGQFTVEAGGAATGTKRLNERLERMRGTRLEVRA